MANQITDNRTLISNADSNPATAPGWANLAGTIQGQTLDTEIFVEGTGSIGAYCTTSRDGTFWTYSSDQNLSNNHIYFWVNCGIVGLLATKANQGLTFRARGPTVSNYLEWDLAGSDDWPTTVEGGWAMFVVDLESTPTRTNGTPPATSALRSLGITFITAATMPRMADNTWIDAMHRLPDGNPGIIVEGRNGGSTDWNWSDLPATLGASNGTAKFGPAGTIVLNTPVQFFIDDGSTHAFTSTNEIVLWENQEFAATDLYKITVLGANTGTANFTMGVKTGAGRDATGSQGGAIIADSAGVRWDFDSDIANIDSCNMYGVLLSHGGDFQIDTSINSWISCTFLDCTSATVSNAEILRCITVDANTADGAAFMTTDDLSDIDQCVFNFSDGHAVELTTPIVATQNSQGNIFTGYGTTGSNDAAIYNNAAGAVTINISDGGDSPTYRNGTSASTTINNAVTLKITGVTEGTSCKFIANETVGTVTKGDTLLEGFADATGEFSGTIDYESAFEPSGLDVIVRARNQGIVIYSAYYDDSATTYYDETTAANSTAAGDVTVYANPKAVADRHYIGHTEKFTGFFYLLSTVGVGLYAVQYKYWTGSAWGTLTTTGPKNFNQTTQGYVSWSVPSDWAETTVNGKGPFYYIRWNSAQNTPTTYPVGSKLWLSGVSKYLPFNQERTVTSDGLTVVATWVKDPVTSA